MEDNSNKPVSGSQIPAKNAGISGSTNELIAITVNEEQQPNVNGRLLHEYLEVKTEYAKWFERMCEYGFTEGLDFSSFLTESTGGRPGVDHALSLDMAKELCMLQRTDKGKEARQYFIAVEKEFNSPEKIMARALCIADQTINKLKLENNFKDQVIGELQPKADYTDTILKSRKTMPISAIAKDYGMGAPSFNKLLHEYGVQYKLGDMWLLYSKYQNKGYTHSKTHEYFDSRDQLQVRMSTEWTQKGRLFIYSLMESKGLLPMIEVNHA